jgi:hypothetical protein
MVKYLPESVAFEAVKAPARAGRDAVAGLFRGGLTRATIAFWVTSFMGLLLVYGLNTWLPQIMRVAGYPLGAALSLLLILNLGGVAGLLVAGYVANRVGVRRAVIGWFAAAALFLALLSVRLPAFGLYPAVFLTGASSSAPRCSFTATSAASMKPPTARPDSAGRPASAGSVPSAVRCSAARCWMRGSRTRGVSTRSPRSARSAPSVSRWCGQRVHLASPRPPGRGRRSKVAS